MVRKQKPADAGTRPHVPILTTLALVATAVADIPAQITFGPVTGSAVLTAAVGGAGVLTLVELFHPPNRVRMAPFWPFVLLTGWLAFLLLLHGVTVEGLQFVLALTLFVTVLLVTAHGIDQAGAQQVRRRLFSIGWALGGIYLAQLLVGGLGAGGIMGRRSFGLEATILIAAAVPFTKTGRLAGQLPTALSVLVVASLSRTAMAVVAALLAVKAAYRRSGFRLARFLLMCALAVAGMVWAVLNLPFLRERFVGGDNAIRIGGLEISSQGRARIWDVVLDGTDDALVLGHGPGAVRHLIARAVPGQVEPHNDFLRVLYDGGVPALVLFVVGLLALVGATLRRALRASSVEAAAPHVAAVLALLAFISGAVTDNVLVYSFVLAPLAVVVGISLSEPPPPPRPRVEGQRRGHRATPLSRDRTPVRREISAPGAAATTTALHSPRR